MPRLSPDERAAAIALRTLTGRDDRSGHWLLTDERTGQVAPELQARGGSVTTWHRWAGPWGEASAGPPAGPFDSALLRIPRARPALRYATERIAAVLPQGAALWVTGCNDEGIKAVRTHLQPWFGELETLDTKHHARLWWGVRTDAPARSAIAEYLGPVELELPGGGVVLRRAPGVFAKGGVDDGSRMLLYALAELGWPADAPPDRVLDLGAGIGVLSAGVLQRWPSAEVHAVDHDAVSIAALAAGLPGVHAHVGDGLGAFEAEDRYDLIVSNPPLHGTGNALSPGLVDRLLTQAIAHLKPSGQLLLVIQRQRPLERMLASRFARVRPVREDGRYIVWHAAKPT